MTAAAVGLSVFATSCNQMDAQKYNNTVVGIYSAYSSQLTSKVNTLVSGSTSKEALEANFKALEKTTDSCIAVMEGLKPVADAKLFHEKTTTLFKTVKSDFLPEMKKMAELKGTENIEAYNKLVDEINATSQKISAQENEVNAAQVAFAQKVGMKVQ